MVDLGPQIQRTVVIMRPNLNELGAYNPYPRGHINVTNIDTGSVESRD